MIKLILEVPNNNLESFNSSYNLLDTSKFHIMNSWWDKGILKAKIQFEDEDTFKKFVKKFYSL